MPSLLIVRHLDNYEFITIQKSGIFSYLRASAKQFLNSIFLFSLSVFIEALRLGNSGFVGRMFVNLYEWELSCFTDQQEKDTK